MIGLSCANDRLMFRKIAHTAAMVALGFLLSTMSQLRAVRAEGFGVGLLLNPEGSRLFPEVLVLPRNAGKPDLRWKTFDWEYTDVNTRSGRYNLYFYKGEEWTASFAKPQIDSQITHLSGVFSYAPSQKFSYLLFNSHRDFQQANIFNITEGVEGITSTSEATMAIPYWGEAESFRHVSTHEMTHQFQVQKVNQLAAAGMAQEVYSYLPLWFVEGMAEYYSLNGMDAESRFYIRDLLINPDKDHGYTMPKLFEEGDLSFVFVYKVGQAKNDFFETQFGRGTVQRLLEASARSLGKDVDSFQALVSRELKQTPDHLEQQWQDYLKRVYRSEADRLTQSLSAYEEVMAAGENLDLFSISPDGSLIAIREIDPLTGVTSIRLIDQKDHDRKVEVTHDNQAGVLSLYFMQAPILALSDSMIAYVALTVSGPEIEYRSLARDGEGQLTLGDPKRIKIHRSGITEATGPSFSPDNSQLAFVGLSLKGWQNIYIANLKAEGSQDALQQITDGYYSWRTLSWGKDGILASSDQTGNRQYNIFHLDPGTKRVGRITGSIANQLAPEGGPDREKDDFVFQSLASGTYQIHRYTRGEETRLTDVKTQLTSPQLSQGWLYALGFKSGKFHLYRISQDKMLNLRPIQGQINPATEKTWTAELAPLPQGQVRRYKPFISSGTRIDSLSGFFGTGSVGGLSATVSDLMRNYSATADFFTIGNPRLTELDLFLSRLEGRVKWTMGIYRGIFSRVDNQFSQEDMIRTYLRQEYGALGAFEYPFGPFSFMDLELRIGGVDRTDYSDPAFSAQWEATNPGNEFMISPMSRLGYDRVLYEPITGPLRGYSAMVEYDASYYPDRGALSNRMRIDGSYYWNITRRFVLALRAVGGAAWGDTFTDSFLVSSDDIMRGYEFNDPRLYGNYLAAADAEFRFPIGSLFNFPFLRGLLAADVGSVSIKGDQLTKNVSSSCSEGISLDLPPLAINFLLSQPIRTAPGPSVSGSVFHFTLRYLYS